MSLLKGSHFLFGLLAFLVSLVFYKVLEDSVSNNIEGMIAAAGFLVAASWGFLQNETNKEIKIRDEVINFISEYENAVLRYVEECSCFASLFFSYYHFCKRTGLRLVVTKRRVEDLDAKDFGELKDFYGDAELFKAFEEIRKQHNVCAMKRNIIALKGELIKEHVSCKNAINNIDDKCKVTLDKVSSAAKAKNLAASEPVIELRDEDFKFIVRGLSEVMRDKVKGFDIRSKNIIMQ